MMSFFYRFIAGSMTIDFVTPEEEGFLPIQQFSFASWFISEKFPV